MILRGQSVRRRLVQTGLVAAIVLAAAPLLAMHRQTPFLVNLSNYPGGTSLNPGAPWGGEPNHVYFQSASDLRHNGSTGSQIYLYVLGPRLPDSYQLFQITNSQGRGDSGNAATGSAGQIVAFDSTADIAGTGNFIRQIFLFYRTQHVFVQLTDGLTDSTQPSIDHDYTSVVFQSTADLKGSGAATPYSQIFLYRVTPNPPPCTPTGCQPDPNRLVQVTNWAGNSYNPRIASDGRYVFFDSDVSGTRQVYRYDYGDGGRILQVTNGAGASSHPWPDDSGQFVAFQSDADLLGTGSTGSQIFYFDVVRNQLMQVTQGAGGNRNPAMAGGAQSISWVSTSDLLGTGAVGEHLFVFDPHTLHTYQVTRDPGTTVGGNISSGNFVLMHTDEDIMRTGMTGIQVYSVDLFNHVQKWAIGKRIMPLRPEPQIAPTAQLSAQLTLDFNLDRDKRSEAPVAVRMSGTLFPPIPVPNYGTFCLTATADGGGYLDCRGGRPGGDVTVTQDHDVDDTDYACHIAGSCREGNACRGPLLSPHRKPCPACVNNVCSGGPNAGAPCADNSTCLLNQTCVDGGLGVCQGPIAKFHSGVFSPGGVQVAVPIKISLSRDAGRDGKWCTTDDSWVFQSVSSSVELTTESASGAILDGADVSGQTLTAMDTGSPFDCFRLEKGNFENNLGSAALVGYVPLLDVPSTAAPGYGDVLVPVRLTPFGGTPYQACSSNSCRIVTYCTTDAQCDDGSVCNGQETCVNNSCVPGAPLVCDDGNACNGIEDCDPLLGCIAGPAPNCDDAARCTTDTCDPSTGACVHAFIPGCCTRDADCRDNNVCNGVETCGTGGNCVPGTPLNCSDGNACNGTETCDPSIGCVAGIAPQCNDGARCTTDACNPTLGCTHTSVHGCCTSDADCIDNNVCNGSERCVNGDCVPGTPLTCDDGNVCNGVETCDPTSGCISGTPLVCVPNGAACYPNTCDPVLGCTETAIPGCCASDADCNDSNACNGVETCVAGTCTAGTPLVCNDNNVCNGVETCNPTTGCVGGTPLTCPPSPAACVTSACDPLQGCVNTSISGCCTTDADCQDLDVCNGIERCVNGDCVSGTPLFCDDGDACNGVEVCDSTLGCQPALQATIPAPFTDQGVRCAIDALWNAFNADSPALFGGRSQFTNLLRLLVRVRRKFGYFYPKGNGQPQKSIVNPNGAIRYLRLFNRRLNGGINRGIVQPSTAQPLIALANEAIKRLAQFNLGAPKP